MRTVQEIREAFGQSGTPNVKPTTIDNALGIGMGPRRIIRRYAGLSRKAVQRHRAERHHESTANDKRSAA
jgi:hypothetical protein